jgi:circadian clock protein KaiC
MHDVQEYIRKLIFGIDDNMGVTTLMTTHPGPWSFNSGDNSIEEFMVSGVITARLTKLDTGRHVRTMFVRKMRGTPTDLIEYTYTIEQDRGIVIGEPLFEAQRRAVREARQLDSAPQSSLDAQSNGHAQAGIVELPHVY